MKTLLTIITILLFMGCSGKPKKAEPKNTAIIAAPKVTSDLKQTISKTNKGKIKLTLNNETYVYDHIDWKKSRIKNDGDIRLSIRQGDLPKIIFKFPDIEKSLADGQDNFEIPDVQRKGFSPITLNFIMHKEEEGKKQEAVSFRKGKIKVSFKNNQFKMEFEGEGGPTLDNSKTYPISGTVNIKV